MAVFGVRPIRIGGVEAFAREFSQRLADRGIRSVLCFLDAPSPAVRAYLAAPNVEVRVIPEVLTQMGAASAIHRLIREFRPEVLLLEFTPFLGTIPWAARASGVPRIYFVDQGSKPEGFHEGPASWWKRRMARVITWPITLVLSISDYNLRSLRSRGLIAPERIVRLYNAADTRRQYKPELGRSFRQRFRIPSEAIVVMQASWMIPEKGIADLISAVARARTTEPRLHLVLAGDGPQRSSYEAQARDLGISDIVTLTGIVPDPSGEGLFDAADIVCQLSRWEEAFGYVIAEAMAVERPVVGTRVGAIPELVVNEQTGITIERGDVTAATAAILRLAADPALRQNYGAAGRRRAIELFDLQSNVKQALGLLGIE